MSSTTRVRSHPGFITCLIIGLLGMPIGILMTMYSGDACDGSSGGADVQRCVLEAQAFSSSGVVWAIGSLTFVMIGVGFQVGRSASQPTVHAGQPMVHAGPPMRVPPPGPGYPQSYPPPYPQQPTSGAGQPPYA